MAIRVSWRHMEPPFWGKGGHRGAVMAPFESAVVVSYRLSIVTVALSQINRGWVNLDQNFRCSPWSRPLMFWPAESEHPKLTNGEITLEEFQLM